MAGALSERWRRSVSWVLTLAAGYLLYKLTGDLQWSALLDSAARTPVWVWMLSIAGFALSHGLRAGRIRSEWQGKLQLTWRLSWALTVRHAAWVVLAPMRTGEAIYVWALHRQGGVALKAATRSLIKLRLQDLAVLLLWTGMLAGPGPWAVRLGVCTLLLLLLYGLPLWLQSMRISPMLGGVDGHMPVLRNSRISWAYALLNWPAKFMALALPMQALSGIDMASAWVAAVGGEWASLIPLQPIAGYGVYEAGMVAGARWMGPISIAEVAGAALFVHTLSLAVTLCSAWLASMLGWSHADFRGAIS